MVPTDLKTPPFAECYFDQVEEFMDVYGYAAPVWVSDPEAEYQAVRTAAAVIDFSMLYKFDVTGPRAIEVVDSVVTRDVSSLAYDRIAYTAMSDERGLMIDDCTIARLDPDRVRVTGGSREDERHLRAAADKMGAEVRARRQEIAHLCLQGPRSREILSGLTHDDVSNAAFPYYTHRDMELAGIPGHVNRMGFTAELGYELFVAADRARDLWTAVFAAGAGKGLLPLGGAALMMLRIEAGMVMGDGLEYDATVSPFECGLGWTVDFGKPSLVGREALLKSRDAPPTCLVSVTLAGVGDAASGAPLSQEGHQVGHISMAVPSPALDGATLGLARVAPAHARPGTVLHAEVDGATHSATVVATPVFDPARRHVRS